MKLVRCMVVSVMTVWMMFGVCGCGASDSDICDTAKSLVSEKLARENSSNPVTCVSVEITKKISDDCWTAKAKLSNGSTVPITLKLHDNDMLEVDTTEWDGKEIEKAFNEAAQEIESSINEEW